MDDQSRELFRNALQEEKDKCHNIRIIVIGHFGTGKTTLIRRLVGDDFDIKTVRSTDGIDIFVLNCTIAEDESWEIEKETADFIEIWVNVICPFGSHDGFPKVFLAATHKDKLKGFPDANEQKISEHFQHIRSFFKGTPSEKKYIFEEDFCFNCSDPNDTCVQYLRRKIIEVAKQDSQYDEEIPSRWLFMERILRIKKQNGQFIISMDEVKSLNQMEKVKISSKEELELFLRFQHAIGEILFFNEDELRNFITLDPQWLIDSLKCIITARSFALAKDKRVSKLLSKLYDEAILKHNLLEIILSHQTD